MGNIMKNIKSSAQNVSKKLFSTGFFHIFGGNVLNRIIFFLSSIVLVRILTKSEYGTFTYAWNIYSIVFIFSGMGVDSGMLQLSGERGGESEYTKRISNYSIRFGLKFNIVLSIALLLIGLFVPLKIKDGGQLLCALCLLPIFQLVFNIMTCYLRTQRRNREFAILLVLNTVLLFITSAGGAFLFREIGLVIGYYFSTIVTCLIGLWAFRIHLIDKENADIGKDKNDLLKIGSISMVNNALAQLLYLLDVFVLGIVDSQEKILASYKVATMIPTALTFIPTSLIIYLYPYFAEHKDDGKWCIKHYKQIVFAIGGFNLVLSAVLFAFAPFIIKIFFGVQYLDAVKVFRILAINYFISGTFRIISGNLLVTQRKLKFNLIESIISGIVNVVADFCLIQLWGSIGAAIATVIVVIVSSVMSTVYLIITFHRKEEI